MREGLTRGRLFTLAALVLLMLPAAVGAETAETEAEAPDVEVTVPAASGSALVIKWNPTIRAMEEPSSVARAKILAEMQKALSERFAEGPEKEMPSEKLANGTVKRRLPLSHMSSAVVRVAPDGELVDSCAEATDTWFDKPVTTNDVEVER